jgi:hypothetical protein
MPSRPDLLPGVVSDGLAAIARDSENRLGHFHDGLKPGAQAGFEPPRLVPFTERGPDELAKVPSFLEQSIGDADPTTLGLLRALGGSLLHGSGSPVQALTDEFWSAPAVREAQKHFMDENEATLRAMSDAMGRAKRALRELSGIKPQLHAREMRDLLDRKSQAGNDTLRRIDSALGSESDPDARAQLQASRDDLSTWMSERDARVGQEREEVSQLANRIDAVESRAYKQRGILEQAAGSEGPRNLVADGRVVETSHHRPEALGHALNLQELLRAAKASLNDAIGH